MSLARRRRLVEVARERELLVLEDNPYGLLRYEGEPLPTLYSLDACRRARRRLRPRDLPGHVLEDPLARGAGRLGGRAAAGAREAEPRQTGRGPVLLAGHAACSSPPTSPPGDWRALRRPLRELYSRRRDVMLDALAEHFGPRRRWTHPQGGLFIWVTLPDYIDTTDLLARALARERRVRARRGGLHGRSRGASSMRLNFSSSTEDEIREGDAADRQDRRASRSALLRHVDRPAVPDARRRRARAATPPAEAGMAERPRTHRPPRRAVSGEASRPPAQARRHAAASRC